ncbi:MAG TPA: glycogen synthase GlgA [Polyangiaceae bacterium]|nr:glycogen synthase GlgA [Polyangiaceae bacterium]
MSTPRSVLFVASECTPLVQVGGLGDVAAALPTALRAAGHDARVVLPRYGTISVDGMQRHLAPLAVPVGSSEAWCAVYETRLPGTDVPVYLLDHLALFGRRYVYAGPGGVAPDDNLARFAFLSRGALSLCRHLGFFPDILHAHDWPSALLPIYLNLFESHSKSPLRRSASVLTIHNLSHQGAFALNDFGATGLHDDVLRPDGLLDGDRMNLLKGGLYHATMLTTVSPRYAEEIRTAWGGCGLDDVLRFRGADLVGILNGIDDRIWDPSNDAAIAKPFGAADLTGKETCKEELQKEMRLLHQRDIPLIGCVTRLTSQKGSDVFAEALDRILALDVEVVMLGAGDPELEAFLRVRSLLGGDRFRMVIGYDEGLSHRIEAGSDLFLMPSRFEPCGLNQMYSQRYGTLPIVRATGGLDDTVEQCSEETGEGTGFKFWDLSPESLVDTVAWAVHVYRNRSTMFRAMQRRAMAKPFGWQKAAAQYAEVYGWALERRSG